MRGVRFAAVATLIVLAAACTDDMITGPGVDPAGTLEAKGGKKKQPPADTSITEPTPPPPSFNPFAGVTLYVDPNSKARRQVTEWSADRPLDAAEIEKIARNSQAKWIGSWLSTPSTEVSRWMGLAETAGAMPVFVAYNIPRLDCSSSGGAKSADAYRSWINSFASALGSIRSVVVVEPDAIAAWGCLTTAERQTRADLIRYAIETFKSRPQTYVYVDAGHPRWQSASEMANRLKQAGIAAADGFALNVSNFIHTSDNVTYGKSISSLIDGKRFVIDTGRNGLGPTATYEWCNPDGRALGSAPSAFTVDTAVDAYLWIKLPGESDGTCNGGPVGGAWWADYALGLSQRSQG